MNGRWSWGGAVALVLAACVGIGWAVALVAAVIAQEGDLSRSGATLLYVLGGTLIGGLMAWLPGRRNNDDDRRNDRDDE